jgi:hypothetical protein
MPMQILSEVSPMEAKPKRSLDQILEIVVVVMLGVTALLTAWASWISALHGGNQATNYATSNNLAAEGNSEYNAAAQYLMQDMLLYNEMNDLQIDLIFAEEQGNVDEVDRISWKLDELMAANMTDEFADAYDWALDEAAATGETVTPFDQEGFVDSYFDTANDLLTESEAVLQQGQLDNQVADAFGLVTVIYSVVLFLLGIQGSFKSQKNRMAVAIISGVAFLIATIYMVTLPLPTGFSLGTFFTGV